MDRLLECKGQFGSDAALRLALLCVGRDMLRAIAPCACIRPGPIRTRQSAMALPQRSIATHARLSPRHVSAQSQSGGRGLTQMQLNVERKGLWITLSRDLYDVVGEKQAPRVT